MEGFFQHALLQMNKKYAIHVNCTLALKGTNPFSQEKVIHWGKTFKKCFGLLFKKTFTQVLDNLYFPLMSAKASNANP